MAGIIWHDIKPITSERVTVDRETGCVEWAVTPVSATLTHTDRYNVQRRIKGQIDWNKVQQVKEWQRKGLTLDEMAFQGKGRPGYSRRSLAAISAALNNPSPGK
jgi:uncharacterized protein YprB with RNaseH-like and TPR domain